jgi:lysophospholipase L1-like esterase
LLTENEIQPDVDRLPATARTPLFSPRTAPIESPGLVNSEVIFADDEAGYVATVVRSRRPLSLARRTVFPLMAIALAIVSACGVAELALRCGGYGRNYTNPMGSFFEPDNELGCHGKPNFVGRFRRTDFDVVVEQDENGFRRGELPNAAAEHDVYVLGDSFVWGYGVGQSDLLTNQIQRQLAGKRVHNLGLIGAGTVQEYLIFQKQVVDKLKPGDAVVLVFFGNDFGDNIGLHLSGRAYATIDQGKVCVVSPQPDSSLHQWKNWMKDKSCLFNLLTYCADRFQDRRSLKNLGDRATRPLPPPEKIQADTADSSPAVRITRYYLSELKTACMAKGVRFYAANVPGQAELGEDDVTSTSDLCLPEETAYRHTFERMVRELGIATVDLMAPMVAAKQSGRFARMTFEHDFHWNSAGHTIAAEAIAAAIK